MNIIPKQLQNPEFRFVKLGKWNEWRKNNSITTTTKTFKDREEMNAFMDEGWKALGKIPSTNGIYTDDWQNTNNYPFNSQEIQSHDGNIGIVGGYGKLAMLDDDSPDKRLLKIFDEVFGDTFTINEHYYFIIGGLHNKIVFYDPIEKDERGKFKHLGELQYSGSQCATVPSIHPLGFPYQVKRDIPIINIKASDLFKSFKQYIPDQNKIKQNKIRAIAARYKAGCGSIQDALDKFSFNGCPYCDDNTTYFVINEVLGSFYCNRCGKTGGINAIYALGLAKR